MARRAGPTTGAVDSRQLGIGSAADRRGGQGDGYRQPVAGPLAGGARRATRASKSARRSEVGDAARAADQAGLVGGIEAAGVGFAASGATPRRQQRRGVPRRRGDSGAAASRAGAAIAGAAVPQGPPPTEGSGAVQTLIGGQPKLADNSLD